MRRIIQPIGDKITIPKKKIKRPKLNYWMGIEDTSMFRRQIGSVKCSKGILTPGWGGMSSADKVMSGGASQRYTDAIAIYDFESGTGTVDTKGTYTTTANGNATITPNNSPPVGSNSGICDGTGDYWTQSNAVFAFSTAYTLSFWIRFANIIAEHGLIAKQDSSTEDGWELSLIYNAAPEGYYFASIHYSGWASTEGTQLWTAWAPSATTWYHVFAVYSSTANTVALWVSESSWGDRINGTTVAKTQDPGAATDPLGIGVGVLAAATLNGQIDEVVLWNTARAETDGQAIFAKNWR